MRRLVDRLNETATRHTLGEPTISIRNGTRCTVDVGLEKRPNHAAGLPDHSCSSAPLSGFAEHRHSRGCVDGQGAVVAELREWGAAGRNARQAANAGGDVAAALSFVVEHKFDGLSSLTMKRPFVAGGHPGNGEVGESILPQVKPSARGAALDSLSRQRRGDTARASCALSSFDAYNRPAAEPPQNHAERAAGGASEPCPRRHRLRRLDAPFLTTLGYMRGGFLKDQAAMMPSPEKTASGI
jgi:hypothetical protein